MGRFVFIRDAAHGGERLVEESPVPSEAALHEVLMRHPSLIPATDLGFGRVVTAGFEANLASGNADLVVLDDAGQIGIVEVKKAGNPDTRRVVAQLLDYAAALWGLTLDDFERDVLKRKIGPADPRGLREFIVEELVFDAEDPEEAAQRTIDGLGETLRTGDFALVLAAPSILAGVRRVIEYLNVRGSSVYGLEVSYFAGEIEAFVPRLVVRPSLSARIAGQDPRGSRTPIDSETFFDSLPERAQEPVRAFVAEIETFGGEFDWKDNRVRVRVRGHGGPRVVVTITREYVWFTLGNVKGLDAGCATRAAALLSLNPPSGAGLGADLGFWLLAGAD